MLLPYGPIGPFGTIRRGQARDLVSRHFASLRMADVPLDDDMEDLDLPTRQKIEIARSVFRAPPLLLLDEPTATLTGGDVNWLGDIIEERRGRDHPLHLAPAAGSAGVLHTVTVLRNGNYVARGRGRPRRFRGDPHDRRTVVPHTFPPPGAGEAVSARRCSAPIDSDGRQTARASFSLRAGEILGVAGLQGMGQLDLFLAFSA